MAKTIFSPASQSDLGSIAEYVSEELGNPKAAIDTVNRIIDKGGLLKYLKARQDG